MGTILRKFKADPDFSHYTWPELTEDLDHEAAARNVRVAARPTALYIDRNSADFVLRLSGIAERSSNDGNPPSLLKNPYSLTNVDATLLLRTSARATSKSAPPTSA
jgi:hypothetical protein